MKVPEGLPRFVSVGGRGLFIALEDVIAHFAPRLFPQMEIVEQDVFRVTRDADYEISDEADDLRVAVELELRRQALRRGRADRGLFGDLAAAARMARERPAGRRRPGLPHGRVARPRCTDAARRARPAGAQGRALAGRDERALPRREDGRRRLPGDRRRATSSSTIRTSRSPRASGAFLRPPRIPTSSGSRRRSTGRTTSRRSCLRSSRRPRRESSPSASWS